MDYKYFLEHSPEDVDLNWRETDLKIRARMQREALPVAPLGRNHLSPMECRS